MKLHGFWRDVAKIAGASALAQAISLVTTPVFTRLYDPAAVGVAAVFMAVVFSIAPVSNLSYNQAIVLAKDDDEAFSLEILSFILTVAVSACLLIPCVVYREPLLVSLNAPGLRTLLWLIPIAVLIKGIYSILLMESSRNRSFGAQGYSRVLQIGTERFLTLGSGFFGKAEAGVLIISRLVSYLFEVAPFSRIITGIIAQCRSLSVQSLRKVALRHRQFPIYANWTILSANLSAYAAIFIISFFFTAEFTGLYAMSERLLLLPLAVFGDSLKSVYYQKAASQQGDRDQLRAFYHRLRERLLVYSIFPTLLLLFFGREIFRLFLGSTWEVAGNIAGAMCLFAFFQFISSPIMSLVNVLGKQRQFFLFTMLLLGARCLSFVVGGLQGQLMVAIWLLTISGSLVYVAINLWMDRLLLADIKTLLFQILKYASISLLLLLCVLFTKRFFSSRLILPLVLVCVCFLYYSIAIWAVEGKTLMTFVREISGAKAAR